MAVELGSGYITLGVEYGDAMKKIREQLLSVKKDAAQAGVGAGKAMGEGIGKGTKDAGKKVGESLKGARNGASKAGTDSGRAMGEGIARETKKGAKKAGDQAGKEFGDAAGKAAQRSTGGIWSKVFHGPPMVAAKGGGTKAAGAFASAFKATLSAAGVTLGIAGVVKGISDVVGAGMTYERSMNSLQGVTSANAQQMAAARAQAQALGSDTKLAGVSAQDAANAMTQLAKAGFTVEQAIDASRGTVQLAVAGQIDAAEAANIQASAMNAFQIKADQATKVADMFAGAVNGSQAEMGDMGYALQMGGTAAAGFKMDIGETLTALTMFAKMGIVGSDAGTMLKTSLIHLANPTDKAQTAMDELGLKTHDAAGVFVGYESIMKQVAEASKHMTDEHFQQMTAILFGTDAMRASMVAANGGAAMWDQAAEAVYRQGAAADMAGAQMQGLPGVIEGLKNTFDGFKLALFDKVKGPLETMGKSFQAIVSGDADNFPVWLKKVIDVAKMLGGAIKEFLLPAFRKFIDNLKATNFIQQFVATMKEIWPIIKVAGIAIGAILVGAIKLLMGIIPPMIKGFKVLFIVLQVVAKIVKAVVAVIITVVKAAWPVIKTVVGAIATAFKAVGAALSWLYNNVWKPIWSVLTAPVKVAWAVMKVIFNAVVAVMKAVGEVAKYLWQKIFAPMWNNIQIVASAAWGVIKPIWEGFQQKLLEVGGAVMAFWHEHITPMWEGVKSAFSAGWEWLKGIFEKVKDVFKSAADFIGGVWDGVVDTIKRVWDGIVDALRGPIHHIGDMLAKVPTRIPGTGFEIPGAGVVQDLGRNMQAFAYGGRVRGPGGTDNVLAWLTSGEGVVTRGAMARGGAELVAALNAGWVPPIALLKAMLPGFSRGGPVDDLYRAANRMVGTPYERGGHSNSGTDCSGAASVLVNALLGDDPYGDRMNTGNAADWLSARGAVIGKGPSGTLRIGWVNGGPGGGHMAVTLPDGRNAESGGSVGNFTIGGGAAGASDFPNQAYIPIDAVFPDGPPGGGRGRGRGRRNIGRTGGGGGSSYAEYGDPNAGAGEGGSGGGTGTAAQQRQLRDMEDRLGRMQREIDLQEAELAEMEAKGKSKQTTLDRKRGSIEDKKKDLQDLKDDIVALKEKMQGYDYDGKLDGGGSGGDSSNPYRKIAEGISEILPDQGQLADLFIGGMSETLLPPGFDSPFDWSSMKAASGVLGFISGLMPDPLSRALLGAGAAGLSGSGSGVVEAIKGIIPEPFGSFPSVFPGEDGSMVGPDAFMPGGAAHFGGLPGEPVAPGPGGAGGTTIDQSMTIGETNANAAELMSKKDQHDRAARRRYNMDRPA